MRFVLLEPMQSLVLSDTKKLIQCILGSERTKWRLATKALILKNKLLTRHGHNEMVLRAALTKWMVPAVKDRQSALRTSKNTVK